MKPITLTICGWGPYRDEQPPIDFEALGSRGLFLITGATGAGKTTIFDAVTYALYGDLSGKTREKGSVRSDFAAPSTKTYVELVMEHGGKRYRIRRNPEYMRPRKRQSKNGELTKEKENAYLTMPDGSCIEGSSEVTARIRELLKVDINQFRQLSMIAQGEFTRLLTAPSSEKSKIFREIFDTKLYERLEAKLKSSSAELYRQVMEYRHRMEEEVSVFSPDEELKAEVEALVAEAGIYSERLLPFLKEKISVFLSEEKRLRSEEKKAEEEIEELAGIVKEAEKSRRMQQELTEKRQELPAVIREYPDFHKRSDFEKQRKEAEEICLRISEKKKTKEALRQERQVLLEKEGLARGSFRDELKKAGFTGEEEYRAAFLPEQKRKEEQEAVRDYRQRCHAQEHLIHHLEEELKVREQRNPAEEQQKLAEIRKKKDSLTEAGSRLWKNRNETEKLYRSLKEKKEKSTALSEKYGIIKDLDDAVNGNNKKRLVLEQYVLAAYFEEILKAANLRLAMMSGGRYTLYRTKEVTDGRSKDSLDMEVLDYYTGRYRSVKTLSGGETFKVSLSLALGMSDVVQAYSGGIQVDALFIDEGFGSLDQESLEQACQTLMSLAESDRMIGIISHVPLLSEKIENQIQVKKTSTGSTYQLVVF